MAGTSIPGATAPDIHPEVELLLCCSRAKMDVDSAARIRLLASETMDWEYVIDSGVRHGIAPLVYRHLVAICPECLPPEARASLRRECHAITINNLFLTDELLRLLGRLETAGIRAIPFKGPVLAQAVYGGLGARAFKDLDILISPGDVHRARGLLAEVGYRLQRPLSALDERHVLRRKVEFCLQREDGRVLLDLRWRLTPKYAASTFDFDTLWSRRGTVCLEGHEVPNLSPEDLLLILCVHGTKHHWGRLDWICGVSELIGIHPELDWAAVERQAALLGVERVLWSSLLLCSELLAARIPECLLNRAGADAASRKLVSSVCRRLRARSESSGMDGHLFRLQAIETFPDRIRFVRQMFRAWLAPTQADFNWVHLPQGLRFLYYVIRPLRLLRERTRHGSPRGVDHQPGRDRDG